MVFIITKPFLVLLLLLLFLSCYTSSALFTPPDNYLISCGSSQNITYQGRTFVPDSLHPSLVLKTGNSSVATTSSSNASISIYQTARVFSGLASYRFKITSLGRHWIRLHFSPINWNLNSASITVVTDDFVLLNNFSFKSHNGSYIFKEYAVNVTSDLLTLTFIPWNGSVVFVNAIEVVSVPDSLIPDQALALNPSSPFSGLSHLAFETVYRLNMGGPLLTSENDTLGRQWENDAKYLHVNSSVLVVTANPSSIKYSASVTQETAPNMVYATADTMGEEANVASPSFNVTWVLPVEPEFRYFVRVHFCDVVSQALNTLVFNLYVNDDLALGSLDLSTLTNGLNVPYFKDFISNASVESPRVLTVSVGPDSQADITNATMNGLEVLKICNEAKSLSGLSSVKSLLPGGSDSKKTEVIIGSAVGAFAAVLLIAVCCYCCLAASRKKRLTSPQEGGNGNGNGNGHPCCISLASTHLGRVFMFQEIMDATNKFDESSLLGVGGFGRVYKGTLEDGTKVAVKRGNPRSEQGMAEFRTEIEMLSKLRHRHLVSLIGYCDERSEMILVYEYMANGPLRSHLYGAELPPLSWKQRLEICIGAARGLHYLHTGASQSIIHRDVKTTNILLDENLVAKVADFGLSKTGPSLDQTHVSTAVKGSFGYLDPEYFRRQQLTEKSDVYSFGVVLMEVLCCRPALNPVLPREQVNIAEWAMAWQKKGLLDQIMDSYLTGKVNPASLK
ncbi:BnaCnng54760D, partial [Brassica napus]